MRNKRCRESYDGEVVVEDGGGGCIWRGGGGDVTDYYVLVRMIFTGILRVSLDRQIRM